MDGRKNNGGSRSGAGRKPKAKEIEIISKIDSIVNDSDWVDIFKKIVLQAKTGSYQHIKLLLEYRFGKPKESVEFNDITENKLPSILRSKDYTRE